jgi:hypothetical protein
MRYENYAPLALRTAKPRATPMQDLEHALLGLATEIGEFATEVKRIPIYERVPDTAMRDHMLEELGDIQRYVPLAERALGIVRIPRPTQWTRAYIKTRARTLSTAVLMLESCVAPLLTAYLHHEDISTPFVAGNDAAGACEAIIRVCDHIASEFLATPSTMVRAWNIEKLRKRFPEAYSDEAAEARADKNGRPAAGS